MVTVLVLLSLSGNKINTKKTKLHVLTILCILL
jgi:hypothetical protein